VLVLELGLLGLLHIVLRSNGSDLLLDLVDHLLLLLLELVLLNLQLLSITDDLLLLAVKLLIRFPLFTLSLK
jgi:hypothetical protein